MPPVSELSELLARMSPERQPGRFAFVSLPAGVPVDAGLVVASVREAEGLSVVLPEQAALELGLPIAFTAAWITLTVQSDLAAVGFTAAFSRAFADAGIGCNVVAGVHHDHVFVPFAQADQAMDVLRALSRAAA